MSITDSSDPADHQDEPTWFDVGDIVVLRGQSQLMTVEDYCPDCGNVAVIWFDDYGTLHGEVFDEDMLVNIDDLEDDDA